MKEMKITVITPRGGSDNYSWMTGVNAWALDLFRGVTFAILGFGVVIEWERKAK